MRCELPLAKLAPVKSCEKGVVFYLLCRAKAIGGVLLKQQRDQALCLWADKAWKSGLVVENFVCYDSVAHAAERAVATEHLVQQTAETPPVLGEVVALGGCADHFRRHKFAGAAQAERALPSELLCMAEVAELEVAAAINEEVFGL